METHQQPQLSTLMALLRHQLAPLSTSHEISARLGGVRAAGSDLNIMYSLPTSCYGYLFTCSAGGVCQNSRRFLGSRSLYLDLYWSVALVTLGPQRVYLT